MGEVGGVGWGALTDEPHKVITSPLFGGNKTTALRMGRLGGQTRMRGGGTMGNLRTATYSPNSTFLFRGAI